MPWSQRSGKHLLRCTYLWGIILQAESRKENEEVKISVLFSFLAVVWQVTGIQQVLFF